MGVHCPLDNMDVVDYRDGLRVSAGKMKWFDKEEEVKLVEVLLKGRAPWGFTLRGGREHREPLVITKVEEGSEAAVSLQTGDEMVSINAVPLSGSRQDAICLVKSSHKTLALVVRRSVKMVDIVSRSTMPSESEVHVARSFLTKILRSSMRKTDPVSRPHSWHSSKLTEEEAEPTESGPSPTPVWQPKHEARPSSKDLSNQGDHCDLRQLCSQFSSVTNMERIDHPSYPYAPARLSPTKFAGSPETLCGGLGKRDSGFSCFSSSFSSSPSPPVPDPGKGTSTENIFYKGLQSEGPRPPGEHPRYLQPPLGNGGWEGPRAEEQPGCGFSNAGRANVCPVWHLPERKKSPPPPHPPLRSDSFAATKVFPYSDGPGGRHTKSQGRGADGLSEANDHGAHKPHHTTPHNEKGPEARRNYNPPPKKGFLHPSTAADCNHNQLHPNKLFSLSSNDVRQTQSSFAYLPNHQRQYSDESPFYLQTRSVPTAKPQSVGSYYRSLQDLPTNASSRKQVRHSTASLTGSGAENGGHSKYYSITAKHPGHQAEPQVRQGKAEGWKGDIETPHWASGSICSLMPKYPLPQSQLPYANNKERNGLSMLGSGLLHERSASGLSGKSSSSSEDSQKRDERHSNDIKRQSLSQHNNDHKVGPPRHQDPWMPQDDHRISPQKTPLLHSLTQESRSLAERQLATNVAGSATVTQDTADPAASGSGKVGRRSDRYATALRNEIQLKRAQLQKSRSAATLTCSSVEEEEAWRSTEISTSTTSSSTYKDHVKEAQARVLQATSFQRRDLEPAGTETPLGKPGSTTSGHLSRIGGRKRFPLNKKMHSFSEPDKIDKVGVEAEPRTGSFGERRRFFEDKPAFSRPQPKPSQADPGEGDKARGRALSGEPQKRHPSSGSNSDCLSAERSRALLEQQRLGTFAEYQASWNLQRKTSDAKAQGRYHSAENILETDTDEKAVCIHERSRSSPSADFYAPSIPVPWRDPVEPSNMEPRHGQQSSSTSTNRGQSEGRLRYQPSPLDQQPQPSHWTPRSDTTQARDAPLTGLSDHRPQPELARPSLAVVPAGAPSHHSPSAGSKHPTQPSQNKAPRPHLGLKTTSSFSSQEFLPGIQAEPATIHQPQHSPDAQQDATAQGCPGSSAGPAQGCPGSSAGPAQGCPGSSVVCPGSSVGPAQGCPGSSVGCPGSSAGPAQGCPGSSVGCPGSSAGPAQGCPGSSVGCPGSSAGPAQALSSCLQKTYGSSDACKELGKVEGRAQPTATTKPLPPPSSSSFTLSSRTPSSSLTFSSRTDLSVPSADGGRSPSPQFAPQRLTDKPPPATASTQEDDAPASNTPTRPGNGSSEVMEVNSAVRKVPVKIVHAESSLEREGRGYLAHSEAVSGVSQGPRPPQLACLGSASSGHPASLFSAYTRQGPPKVESAPGGRGPSPSLPGTDHGTVSTGARRSEEDAKREELARDIMDKDKSLADILDQSRMKTTMDLMKGLFPQGEHLLEGALQRRRGSTNAGAKQPEERRDEDRVCASASLVPSSSYYSTSAPKAELLIKMKDMQEQMEDEDCEDELDVDLASKKQELISSLAQKLEVLREARLSLQEDVEDNDALGRDVDATVQRLCRANQLDKFRMFVGDLDKVVSLLLSLSGRLARVENALNGLEDEAPPEEKRTLTQKRKLLMRQHEDAKELKENLDRRQRLVSGVMEAHLDAESLADYRHFVKMKSGLIIEQRKLEDKIKLGEEQLKCLVDSLPLEQRVHF